MANKVVKLLAGLSVTIMTLYGCSASLIPTDKIQDTALFTKNSVASFTSDTFIRFKKFVKGPNTLISVKADRQAFTKLSEDGFDIFGIKDGYAVGEAAPSLMQKLKSSQTQWNLIGPGEGYTIQNNFDTSYHTYETMLASLQDMEKKYPKIAKLYDIGDSWEKTKGIANRDIWMMHITGKGDGSQKPGIVFFGNHHARELVTVEVPLLLIEHLLSNYGKDPEITKLVDTREIWIAPMVNPDGHAKAEKGRDQRKNTNSSYMPSSSSALSDVDTQELRDGGIGVDLNRNYGYKWGTGGSSITPSSATYMGPKAFSEPETQACRDFMQGHKNLKMMMSYHSYSNLVLYPWGCSTTPPKDDAKLTAIGKKLASFNGYEAEHSSDLYIASGITDDWSYGELGIFSFTTEIGSWEDGFDPPYSKVAKFWNENRPGALYLIQAAGDSNLALTSVINPLFVNTFNR